MSEIFAKRLKQAREAKDWTQSHMAELLGISNGTLSGYERNYREPDISTVSRISEFLGISVDYLLGRTDSPISYDQRLIDKFSVSQKDMGQPSARFDENMGLALTPPEIDKDLQPTPPERIRTFQKKVGELSEESLTFLEFQLERLRELDQEAVKRRRSERDSKRGKN